MSSFLVVFKSMLGVFYTCTEFQSFLNSIESIGIRYVELKWDPKLRNRHIKIKKPQVHFIIKSIFDKK